MYYWIIKVNVSRDIPVCHIYCSYKVLFLRKKTEKDRKSTKNLIKTCQWNLFLLFEVIAREHLGTQGKWARKHVGTWARKARWHVHTQGTLVREHVSTQGKWAREHASTQGTLAREHAGHVGTRARKHVRQVGTWVRMHARHSGTWARKACNLADSQNVVLEFI